MLIYDKLYIPINDIDVKKAKKLFNRRVFVENACRTCSNLPERFNDLCAVCPSYKGAINLFTTVTSKKGQEFVALPYSNIEKLEALGIDISEAKNKTPIIPFKYPLRFTGTLRDGSIDGEARQAQAVAHLLKSEDSGMLMSPPRTGKTVMSVALICKQKWKTVIIASKLDYLVDQFYKDTFLPMTNLEQLQNSFGKQIVGVVRKNSDFEELDVALVTYQKLMRDPERIKRYINGKFSMLLIDECDQIAARGFAKVVSSMAVRRRIGVSGTRERKDRQEEVISDILGPTLIKLKARNIKPVFNVISTGTKVASRSYAHTLTMLADNEQRNKLIVAKVIELIKTDPENPPGIIVVCQRNLQIATLVKQINREAVRLVFEQNLPIPKVLAVAYDGKTVNRADVLAQIKNKQFPVTVGMISVIKRGLNIPYWSHMLITTPISSQISPDPEFVQLSLRVSTPMPDKPTPQIYYLLDQTGLSHGCLRSTYYKSVMPLGYFVPEESLNLIKGLTGRRGKAQGSNRPPAARFGEAW